MAIKNKWETPFRNLEFRQAADLQHVGFGDDNKPIYVFIIEGRDQTLFSHTPHFCPGLDFETKYSPPFNRYIESFLPKNRTDIKISELEMEVSSLKSMILRQNDVITPGDAELISLKNFYGHLNSVIFPTIGILSALMLFIISLSFFSGLVQTLALFSSLMLLGLNLKSIAE